MAIQIVELARSLDLDVIAEGVETIEQAMAVSTHGVAKAQGWLYGRAVPLDELLRRLPEACGRRRAATHRAGSARQLGAGRRVVCLPRSCS